MNYKYDTLQGALIGENNEIPVEIYYASLFSIFVKIKDKSKIRDGKRFIQLNIEIDEKIIVFKNCKFHLETSIDNINGRLVFLKDVYNFEKLFASNEVQNLEHFSNDLLLMLNQKERITSSFKDYISDLSYDLKIYKSYFNDLDNLLEQESEPVKSIVSQTIINTEGRKFMDFFIETLSDLKEIISSFSKNNHNLHGLYLRKQLWDIIICSEFMMRTNIKPRGYAGDSEMMQMIYENGYRGDSTFGKLLYKISLEHPASQAVRNRRIMIPKILRSIQKEITLDKNEVFSFLSVACGPAYELQDLFVTDEDINKFNCTLLDQDEEALDEASKNIKHIEKTLGYKVNARYLKNSVRTMLKTKTLSEEFGTFHYIYSMGLFDYLTTPVAKAVLEKLYSLLKPGGKILIGNYHIDNPSRIFMEYWHDWVLFYRDEEEFASLLEDTTATNIKIIFEETKSQMFLTAAKPY